MVMVPLACAASAAAYCGLKRRTTSLREEGTKGRALRAAAMAPLTLAEAPPDPAPAAAPLLLVAAEAACRCALAPLRPFLGVTSDQLPTTPPPLALIAPSSSATAGPSTPPPVLLLTPLLHTGAGASSLLANADSADSVGVVCGSRASPACRSLASRPQNGAQPSSACSGELMKQELPVFTRPLGGNLWGGTKAAGVVGAAAPPLVAVLVLLATTDAGVVADTSLLLLLRLMLMGWGRDWALGGGTAEGMGAELSPARAAISSRR
mmetsp:Transcript_10816/g.29678  ORF Transcript_10816/g.29678 Transcript_10816/m.29678 type:complete len:265 (+) Transcript_10816:1903-2697(+)